MEFDTSVESSSVIRVAVLAVGQIPPFRFREYVEMVAERTSLDLRSIRPFYRENKKSPFSQLPWETGRLTFKFMVGGATRNKWEEFQSHRKIHGVIGICHCPFLHDLESTYEQFTTVCNSYPFTQATRCLAFYPSDDQRESNKKPDFVMLPCRRETLKLQIQNQIYEFAAAVLMDFESRVVQADYLPGTITTPLDPPAAVGEEANKMKKKRLGRVQKTIGDYCLLAGSPAEANAHFMTAMELSRLSGDSLWHAGAAEGSMNACMADRTRDYSTLDEVKARYFEIAQLYRRVPVLSFELDVNLKLAKILCRKECVKDVVEILSVSIENGKRLIEANDRSVLLVEASRIYGALGYERKAAFFAREVAHLYLQQHNVCAASSALQVLHLISGAYRLSTLILSFNDAKRRSPYEGHWNMLQIDVLGDMLAAATRGGDALTAWNAASQLLRGYYPFIAPTAQISLATALSTAAEKLPSGSRSFCAGLPFIRFHSFPEQGMHVELVKRKPGKKDWWTGGDRSGPFIYTPLSGKAKRSEKLQLIWVVDEPVQVFIEVSNPCAFEVQVESISLFVEGVDFEAFPLSFSLPPNGFKLLSLFGKPLSAGSLRVRGCFVNTCGVVAEHCFGLPETEDKKVDLADPFRGSSSLKLREKLSRDIEVIPPLPYLVVDVVGGEGAFVLYEGEVCAFSVNLCNVSQVPVMEAAISVVGKRREHIVNVASEALHAVLPLNGGQKVRIPVVLEIGCLDSQSKEMTKEETVLRILIHYAGEAIEEPAQELNPGRRLSIPLQVTVLPGIRLTGARLLSMEVPLQLCRSLPSDRCNENTMVKMDPYRGSWNLRVLEMEAWNGTDEVFEVTVSIMSKEDDSVYASSKVHSRQSARLLVPLDKFKLAAIDKTFLARCRQGETGKALENEVNSIIEDLCTRISVKWSSGKKNSGKLQLRDAVRETLREAVFDILLPDPLTFGFRLAKGGQSNVLAHELVPIEMLVRNNWMEDITVVLSVACRDVTGATCLAGEQTILWSGALDGVEVELCALGEAVHRFELYFLVPGEYILLGAALISSHDAHESLCYCGPPFTVHVDGFS